MKIVANKFNSLPIFAFYQPPKSSCCHLRICTLVTCAKALTNGLFIWKTLLCKKPLTIKSNA